MHREFTTAYTQVHARELGRAGWRAIDARDQAVVKGRKLELRPDYAGGFTDGFSARMTRDIKE